MLGHITNRNTLVLLLCGFSLLIVLMVAITYQSLSQLEHSNARLDNIVTVHNEKSVLIQEMQHANRERVISLQQMFIARDFFDLDAAAIKNVSLAGDFLVAREKLDAMPRAAGEDRLLVGLNDAAAQGAPLNDRVRDILWSEEEGARAEARNLLADDVLASQNRIYAVFDALNRLYEREAVLAAENSAQEYADARWLILRMLQLTVLLSVLTAFYVTALILRNQKMLKLLVRERTRELQHISTEAIAARREAEDANNAKSIFLANMSHELRTPLNAVLGFSEIMDREIMGPMSEAYREYPQHINSSAKHLLQMIQQLLDMSRIEAGHLELDEKRVCMRSLLNETATIVRSAFGRDGETLVIEPSSMCVAVHGDQRMLKQTLINIIGNAAKYSGDDDPVTVSVELRGGDTAIAIRDRGMGIAAEEIPRLFNPYERSEAETAREKQGTGLGLAISRSLIEAHGGTLTLESVLGEGTTVTIVLPAIRVIEYRAARPMDYAA